MLNLLRLVHVFFGLNAMGAGVAVCTRMITGKSFGMWVKNFLRFSLATSSVGLILSIHHTSVTQLLTILTVYLSGFAVFSWRKYVESEAWGPAVVISTVSVFCMHGVIMTAHVCRAMAACNLLSSGQIQIYMLVPITIAVGLFAVLSAISLRQIHQHSIASTLHRTANRIVSPGPPQNDHSWANTGQTTLGREL